MNSNNIKKLSGDASFRKFFRNEDSVLVFCKKDKKSNLLIYDAINKILIKKKILAPKLISQNYKNNFIEIEDFGDLTVLKQLKKSKINKKYYYKKVLNILLKINKIKIRKQKTFLNSYYKIPNYTNQKLLNEANLFLEWYLPKYIIGIKNKIIKKKLKKVFKELIKKINYNKKVFVHRDFHVSNIMITQKGFGLIDSQDAIYGNIAYDLASLIDDVRIKTSIKIKDFIFNEFMKVNINLDYEKFKNDFEILSVLRNIKIIGIFTRLSIRDKKNQYRKLIPYAWKMIEFRIKKNPVFYDLNKILNKNFNKKIRKLYEN